MSRAAYWISVFATFAVLAETGMRKADVSQAGGGAFQRGRLSFGSLTWEIDGVHHTCLAIDQLRAARAGYACYLVYGAQERPVLWLAPHAPRLRCCGAVECMPQSR